MKKLLGVLLVLSLLLVICFPAAFAEESEPEVHESGEYQYVILEDGTAEITMYTGKEEELNVPDELDGIQVTGIGNNAFPYNEFLIRVTIPDNVIHVGYNPFATCEKLKDIIVSPDHPYLAVIDGVLFSKPDKRLICYPGTFTETAYTIPYGILSIGEYAFLTHYNLTSSLISISFPESLISIGDDAFFNCKFTSIVIPDSVTSIGKEAFYQCSSLMTASISNNLTCINEFMFASCNSLTSIIIPDSVTSIENSAFSNCKSLTTVIIPEGVTHIGQSAFYGCESLTSITIPESVISIGEYVFDGCDLLTVTVARDSYAAQYCKDNNLKYTYTDANDWLNN